MLELLGIIFVAIVGGAIGSVFGVKLYRHRNPVVQTPKPPEAVQGPGQLHFKMKDVRNPVVVEAFMRKFDEAVVATSHCPEFYDGTLEMSFEIKGCAVSENLKKDLEASKFNVTDSK